MGTPGYTNANELTKCADNITITSGATVIVNPNDGYVVDSTPLMSASGVCDTDFDYSRTQPVLASGQQEGSSEDTAQSSSAATALQTVVQQPPATSAAVAQGQGKGRCGWRGHCKGAPCMGYSDCAGSLECIDNVCT